MHNHKSMWAVCPRLWQAAIITAVAACVLPAQGQTRRTGQYLVVTPPTYASAAPLTQFINHRTAQGFTVSVYNVPTGTSRNTIKTYIENMWSQPEGLDYILIVGDTSNTSTSTATQIPHWTGTGDKGAPTDLPYAAMPGGISWYIDIPIGRFSVSSVTELTNVVNKTIFVESGSYPNPQYIKRGAFLANSDTQGMAEPTHDYVVDQLMAPRGYTGIKIYASQGGNTQHVTNAINTGCLWVVYYGHSGSSGWWSPAFYQNNVTALTNTGLYGLACGWSCNTSNFPTTECFGETWIRAANKGSAAYISASTYIYWGSQSAWLPSTVLEKAFFDAFFLKDIWEIGPAWNSGLYKFLSSYGQWDGNFDHLPSANVDVCHNFFEEFVILGDPALLLPQPSGFMLSAEPSEQDVCSATSNQAFYTVTVEPLAGFTEAVSLTAQNLPSGTSASFSPNGQVPPFTSTMTVNGLVNAPPGDYSITVRGTSATSERSTNVGLGLANAAPAAVTLLAPSDGATGVLLMPQLAWQAGAQAQWYDVEVATDTNFTQVVFSATVETTDCVVNDPALNMYTRYYWRVRGSNPCGDGAFSTPFSFTTINMVRPSYYDLQNGQTGTYTYFDDSYDGDGDKTVPLAWLRNGLGDLTDGVIATQHWNVTSGPYVGWNTIDPEITFYFDDEVTINTVILYLDDNGGGGGVAPPQDVRLVMGGQSLTFPCTDPPGDEPFAFVIPDLNLTGTSIAVKLSDYSSSGYMMLSEVEFYSDITPCVGDLNGDGVIDISDLATLLGNYGSTTANPEDGDLDGDGDVDIADLATLLSVYGTNCP